MQKKHKANGLAAALKKDKTNKAFWHHVDNKNRVASIPMTVGGVSGGSEIVHMWKDYFSGILNADQSANLNIDFVNKNILNAESYQNLSLIHI